MVSISRGTFRCVLLSPKGKLLDCRTGSVILPAHDGMRGILRNHTPMLCELGLGIVEVKEIAGRKDAFFLIDGGFCRISENYVTIVAYDVLTFEGMDREQAESIVSKAREIVVGKAYIRQQLGQVDLERAGYIVKLGKLSSIFSE